MTTPEQADLRLHFAVAYGGGLLIAAVLTHLWPEVWWLFIVGGVFFAVLGIVQYVHAMWPRP